MSRFPVFRLPTLSFPTTHVYADSTNITRSASSVFASFFVSFSESVMFLMSSLRKFRIRFQNNLNSFPCNGFVYKSEIIISVEQYSNFIFLA